MAANASGSQRHVPRFLVALLATASLGLATWPPLSPAQEPAPPTAPEACAQAKALTDNGKYDDAAKSLGEAVAADPGAACIAPGYARIKTVQVTHLCQQAQALDSQDQDAEAQKLYIQALQIDPSRDCALDGLEPSATDSWEDRFDKWGGPADAVARLFATIGKYLGLLAGALGVLLLLYGTRQVVRRLRRTDVEIQAIGDDSTPGAAFGSALTAMVKETFIRKTALGRASGDPSSPVAIVAAPEDLGGALGKLTAISPQFGLVSALVTFAETFLPLKRFQAAGETLPGSGDKIGLSLLFQQQGSAAAATDIWRDAELSLPIPEPHASNSKQAQLFWLSEASAAWIEYQLAIRLSPESRPTTDSFGSYLVALAGAEQLASDNAQGAQTLFARAIDIDGSNWSAEVSLGLLKGRGGDFARAAELLEKALDERRAADASRTQQEALGVA